MNGHVNLLDDVDEEPAVDPFGKGVPHILALVCV